MGRDANGGVIVCGARPSEGTRFIHFAPDGTHHDVPTSPSLEQYRNDQDLYFYNPVVARGASGNLYLVGSTDEPLILTAQPLPVP